MPVRTTLDHENLQSAYSLGPSSLETIDYAIYNYINDTMNIHVTTNKGFQKLPIVFSIPERAYQIKNDPSLRPNGRTLAYPMVSIEKTTVVQNPANKAIYGVNIPPYFDYYNRGGSIPITRKVNQAETQPFANANAQRKSASGTDANYQTFPGKNKNIVYETVLIPMPTWLEITYSISMIAEYHQHMNEMLSPFHTITGDPSIFRIAHEHNSYEAFVDPNYTTDFKTEGLDTGERVFTSGVQIKVLGYIIGAEGNQDTPIAVHRQSPAKIRFARERSTLGEEPDFHANRKDKYRP
jgi:hypothetical protein